MKLFFYFPEVFNNIISPPKKHNLTKGKDDKAWYSHLFYR